MLYTKQRKIPLAIVGLNFGRHIIDSELLTGGGAPYFELAGVCDMDRQRASAASAELGVRAYTDLDDLLANPDIPAIGLYTGPSGRADLLHKIICAGKDVITTKPFEVDAQAALLVLNEARKLGRIVHLNSPAPVRPADIEQIATWQKFYNLGEPVGCRAEVWANYDDQADGTWMDDPEKCPVAPIFRLGIYLINDLIAVFGEAESVQVFASRLVPGRPTPDNSELAIRFKNGGLASIFATFRVDDGDYYRNSLVVNFRRGTVYRNVGPHRKGTSGDQVSEMALVVKRDGARVVAAETRVAASGGYRWDVFYRALMGESIVGEIAPEQIIEGLKIIRAMAEAQRAGCSVRVV